MDDNKKAAIEKILLLTKQDAEFNEELRRKLEITSDANSAVIDDERLSQIYEYCIEDVLRKQAENFYEPFNNTIKEKLIHDYIRMEGFRRKNEFGDYTLALYQQIETILNVIFGVSDFKVIINRMWNVVFYKYQDSKSKNNVEWTISSIIFGTDTEDKKWYSEGIKRAEDDKLNVRDKIRIVLFYFKFFANSKYNIESNSYISSYNYNVFKSFFDTLWDIYSCRNTNHRNPEQNENETVRTILQNTTYYYFQFNWILTEFIWLTKDYISTIETIKKSIPKERKAIVTQILPTIAYAKMEGNLQPTRIPDNLLKKMKGVQIDDQVVLIVMNDTICDIKKVEQTA